MTTEKLPRLLPIIIAALLLAGCATTWNEHQRATLTAASVQKPTVKRDAYHNPDATKSPGMANSIPNMTGGGLIPALAEHKKVAISNAGNALQEIVDRKLGRNEGRGKGGRS